MFQILLLRLEHKKNNFSCQILVAFVRFSWFETRKWKIISICLQLSNLLQIRFWFSNHRFLFPIFFGNSNLNYGKETIKHLFFLCISISMWTEFLQFQVYFLYQNCRVPFEKASKILNLLTGTNKIISLLDLGLENWWRIKDPLCIFHPSFTGIFTGW